MFIIKKRNMDIKQKIQEMEKQKEEFDREMNDTRICDCKTCNDKCGYCNTIVCVKYWGNYKSCFICNKYFCGRNYGCYAKKIVVVYNCESCGTGICNECNIDCKKCIECSAQICRVCISKYDEYCVMCCKKINLCTH